MKPGPRPNYKLDKKVADYRAKGLSYAKIAKLMGLAVNNVFRRANRYFETHIKMRCQECGAQFTMDKGTGEHRCPACGEKLSTGRD